METAMWKIQRWTAQIAKKQQNIAGMWLKRKGCIATCASFEIEKTCRFCHWHIYFALAPPKICSIRKQNIEQLQSNGNSSISMFQIMSDFLRTPLEIKLHPTPKWAEIIASAITREGTSSHHPITTHLILKKQGHLKHSVRLIGEPWCLILLPGIHDDVANSAEVQWLTCPSLAIAEPMISAHFGVGCSFLSRYVLRKKDIWCCYNLVWRKHRYRRISNALNLCNDFSWNAYETMKLNLDQLWDGLVLKGFSPCNYSKSQVLVLDESRHHPTIPSPLTPVSKSQENWKSFGENQRGWRGAIPASIPV